MELWFRVSALGESDLIVVSGDGEVGNHQKIN